MKKYLFLGIIIGVIAEKASKKLKNKYELVIKIKRKEAEE